MVKRYLLTLLLAIVSAGALTACGGGDEIDDDPDLRCVIDGIPRKPEACV